MKEICVLCGNETIYDFTDHIDTRYGYIEGMGQLCIDCYSQKNRTISVPVEVIKKTPNDAELGSRVRNLYWQSVD